MDSLNDNEINKIHKDINKLREQNITHFNMEKLAIMFKNFATHETLNDISKTMNVSAKVLKQNLKLAMWDHTAEDSYKFCSNCKNRLTTIFKVSHREWVQLKMQNVQNPVQQIHETQFQNEMILFASEGFEVNNTESLRENYLKVFYFQIMKRNLNH
ncbi:hypothetical protein SAM46_02990 [Mycoplasmopsis verecunda]|uniref:hypothetical protein n=1 Tax=Mycoplasmopsis verecunda TaxID=171291 RepID=UPI00298C6CC9|nr:hypothetical protein [Mycoplasmopsis verecunda]WPB54429.1 hypothetical protein SAM46_02990 [Mycoplasmopsis verecunda]